MESPDNISVGTSSCSESNAGSMTSQNSLTEVNNNCPDIRDQKITNSQAESAYISEEKPSDSVRKPSMLAGSLGKSFGISGDYVVPEVCKMHPKCTLNSVTWLVSLTPTHIQFYECMGSKFSHLRVPGVEPDFSYPLTNLLYHKVLEGEIHLQFVGKIPDHKFKLVKLIKVYGFSTDIEISKWVKKLNAAEALQCKPRNLAFIINPMSGKKDARKFFSKNIVPILKATGISFTKFETEYRNHAAEICEQLDVKSYDGVVVCGGDGTANEVIKGLQTHNVPDKGLETLPVKIGTVPCGTSNNISYAVHGTDDKLTGLCHVLLGHDTRIDMMSAWNHDSETLIGLSMTMIAYGFIADAISFSGSYRWLPGQMGYTVAFLKSILRMEKYPGNLELYLAKEQTNFTPKTSIPCGAGCLHCKTCPDQDPGNSEVLNIEENKIFGVQIHNNSGICKLAPRGASTNAHLGDGCMDVIVTRDISKNEALAMLKQAGQKEGENFPFDYVEVHRTNQVVLKIRPEEKKSCWILDGEVVPATNLKVKSHKQAVPFFGTGIETENPSTRENTWTKVFGACAA